MNEHLSGRKLEISSNGILHMIEKYPGSCLVVIFLSPQIRSFSELWRKFEIMRQELKMVSEVYTIF